MAGLVEDAGTYWAAQLGFQFDVCNLQGEAWFTTYTLKFSEPILQTTLEGIQEVIALGQKDGWGIPEMQKNMELLFRQWMAI